MYYNLPRVLKQKKNTIITPFLLKDQHYFLLSRITVLASQVLLHLHARNSLEQGKQRAHPSMGIARKQEIQLLVL